MTSTMDMMFTKIDDAEKLSHGSSAILGKIEWTLVRI